MAIYMWVYIDSDNVAWRPCQAIIWTDVDLWSFVFPGIHPNKYITP